MLSSYILEFRQNDLTKVPILTFSSVLGKIWQIPYVVFKITCLLSFKFCMTLQCLERWLLCTFLGQILYTFHKSNQSKCKSFEGSYQYSSNSCHFWNKKFVFLQVLHQSSVSWDINPGFFCSWKFIYFHKKEPIKAQKSDIWLETCSVKYNMRKFVNVHSTSQKSQNFTLMC